MKTPTSARVVVLGASENPERYAFKAAHRLVQAGFSPELVGQKAGTVAGHSIQTSLQALASNVPLHTVTLYVGPARQADVMESILTLRPQRIIFNPGTENAAFEARAQAAGIETIEACTLVLLASAQF